METVRGRVERYVAALVLGVATCPLAGGTALGAAKVLNWVMTASSDDIKVYQALISAFQAQYPDVRVELIVASSGQEFDEKVNLLIASGDPPAIWYPAGSFGYRHYAAQGLLMDVEGELARRRVDLSDFNRTSLDFLRWEGRLRGLPANDNVNFLMYNKELFAQSGVAYPPSSWADKSWTWDAFLTAAKKLTRLGPNGQVEQYAVERVFDPWAVPWMFGGDWVPPEAYVTGRAARTTVTQPQTVQALQFWADLVTVHRVAPGPGVSGFTFASRRAAMTMGDIGALQSAASLGLSIGVAPYPRYDPEIPAVTVLLPNQWVVFARQKHPQEALEFFIYLTSKEGMTTIWPSRGYRLPSRRSLWPLWVQRARTVYRLSEETIGTVLESFNYARVRPSHALLDFGRMVPAIQEQLDLLLRQRISARQAVEALQPVLDGILVEGR